MNLRGVLVSNKEPLVLSGVRLDLVDALASDILAMTPETKSETSNNVGGWKSQFSVLDGTDTLRELRKTLTDQFFGSCELASWAMVNRAGSEHKRHMHGPNTKLCGLYYVTPGDPPTPTIFELERGEMLVPPIPGNLVFFTGGMWHRVPKYDGETPRITIAFETRSH